MHPTRILAYARVSSIGQATYGTSLEGQREELQRYARANGLPEPVMYVEAESGAAAKAEARTEQLRLMADVRAGDLVLVAKQDRWSRDTIHFLQSADQITARGGRFLSLAERFDPSTPEGRFAATMMAAVAEQERARIRERTIGTRRRLRASGLWVEGPPPMGYLVIDRRLVIDEKTAATVRSMFDLCVEGRSTHEITNWLRDNGTPVDRAAVGRRLRDRRYLGEMPLAGARHSHGSPKGATWIAAHPPLIDRATWERAQRSLESRRQGGAPVTGDARNVSHLLRGLVSCALCGHRVTAHAPELGASVRHGGWYVCRWSGCRGIGTIRHDVVDIDAGQETLARVEALADRIGAPAAPSAMRATPDFAAALGRVVAQRKRLVDAISRGTISDADARERIAELDAEAAAVRDREAAEKASRVVIPVDMQRAALRDLATIERKWARLKPAGRREIVSILAQTIELGRPEQAKPWARGAFELRMSWRELGDPSAPSIGRRQLAEVPFAALATLLPRWVA